MKKPFRLFLFSLCLCTLCSFSSVQQSIAAPTLVAIETSLGTIVAELDTVRAPISSANFLSYAKSGFYNGTIFHRVIRGFMIQGGGLTQDMKEKPTRAPIKNESTNNLRNQRHTLAMARTSDPDSATSQFFINTVNNRFLDREKAADGVGYAVFGRVVKGQDVVQKIESVNTKTQGYYEDVPAVPVVIKSVSLVK